MCYSAQIKNDPDFLSQRFAAEYDARRWSEYQDDSAVDPKLYPPLSRRVFPGGYAPVVHMEGKNPRPKISLMRYGAYPQGAADDLKHYTTFNARRDNLTSPFWSNAFLKHHGFVILQAFYEWVNVSDLLSAGKVSLQQVENEFEKQRQKRQIKIESQGKKYKPTPTELKDPLTRKIIIQFKPIDAKDLLVPVIASNSQQGGKWNSGFAIITDDPPTEIQVAGHDRCPLIVKDSLINDWMLVQGRSAQDFNQILTHRQEITFTHELVDSSLS